MKKQATALIAALVVLVALFFAAGMVPVGINALTILYAVIALVAGGAAITVVVDYLF